MSTTEGTMVAVEDPNHTFWSTLTVSDETDADYTVSLQRVATGPGYTYLERVQGITTTTTTKGAAHCIQCRVMLMYDIRAPVQVSTASTLPRSTTLPC